MSRSVIDTNVPIVANGGTDQKGGNPSVDCRIAAVEFLMQALKSHTVLLDSANEIQSEYRKHLSPSGQPGPGDRFYQSVLTGNWDKFVRVDLPRREDGEYEDVPQPVIDAGFDRSDRKFVAVAKRAAATVVNATDSDWLQHRSLLGDNGIDVNFVCGCNQALWFGN